MKILIKELTSILAQNEAYVYIRPDLRLQPYIAHYTISLSHDSSTSFLTLVPDVSGCLVMPRIDKEFTCSYWGPTTKTVIVEAQQASKEIMMFVEFRPGGAYSLFHLPLHKVSDQQIPMSDIFPVFHKKLEEAYHSSNTIQEFIHHLNDLFLSILEEKEQHHLLYLLSHIQNNSGTTSLSQIETISGYSRRHLQRLFQEQLGTPLRTLTRIQRINQAIELMQKQIHSLTQIAHTCGYYDQAHFNHDFKQVVQLSPSQYLSKMSKYYKEPFKI